MFALVQYHIDSTTAILECSEIQGFTPKNVADFDAEYSYRAYWCGDDDTLGGYYEASIHHLSETKEEMEMFLKSWNEKRLRKASSSAAQKRPASSKEKVPEQKKKLRKTVQCKSEVDLLAQFEEQQKREEELVPKEDFDDLKEKLLKIEEEMQILQRQVDDNSHLWEGSASCENCLKLRQEVDDLKSLNKDLQRSLVQKVFSAESRIIHANSLDVTVSATSQLPRSANKVTGQAMLSKPRDNPRQPTPPLEASPFPAPVCDGVSIDDLDLGASHCELNSSYCELDSSHCELNSSRCELDSSHLNSGSQSQEEKLCASVDTVIGSTRDDGKIYAGSSQWLDSNAWSLLMRSPSDSMFCRSASMVFWTTEELKVRSVTRTLSNKYKSLGQTEVKPALSPEKLNCLKALFQIYMGDTTPKEVAEKRMKAVRKHLAQKLGDVQRNK